MKGAVHSIETFGSADGPGVRFLIFLQGCAMRCAYCHNADTWKMHEPDTEAADLLKKAVRYKNYWKNGGGITVSGGEPLLQIEFVTELFEQAKKLGIHTCLDTSGQPFSRTEPFFSKFERLMRSTDLVMLDLKHMDDAAHRDLCQQPNGNIQDLARYLSDTGKPVWIRHVLVPGVTDDPAHLQQMRAFINTLSNVERVEVLPFHRLGMWKWEELGMKSPLAECSEPNQEQIAQAVSILKAVH